MRTFVLVILVQTVWLGTACSGGALAARPVLEGLPAVESLDAIPGKAASDVNQLDVTLPLDTAGTSPNYPALAFAAPADGIAYAVYRIDPPSGPVAGINVGGTGALWAMMADYADSHWDAVTPLGGEWQTPLDLGSIGQMVSGGGFIYVAVACPQAQSGSLELIHVAYLSDDPYGLQVTPGADGRSVVLTWASGHADSFRVCRSTMPQDPAPYVVGTVLDNPPGANSWTESMPEYLGDNTWLPQVNDNDTPGDPGDDFPTFAPEVYYYYSIVPVSGGIDQPRPPEVFFILPWGSLRTARRSLPATTARTRVFADQLIPGDMTPAQVAWCAGNLVGTQKIFKSQADAFRAVNPDFLVLGYHLAAGAGPIGNVCGNGWDDDADWPYLDRHASLFLRCSGSSQPGGRVLQQDWGWYVADPASPWTAYLSQNLLEQLGEDHFDGWFLDSCSEPWNTDPAQWWPDGETMFGFWTPRLNLTLSEVMLWAGMHPLHPYIIPNAGPYVTTLSDIKYYGDGWACDGIMIEGHAHWSPGSYFGETDWALQADRILDHQAHGLATILQTDIDPANTSDRLFVFASYLLVRGDHTYINWLGEGQDAAIGQYYPEFDAQLDTDIGAPAGPPPATIGELKQGDGLYRRDFAGGAFVLVNPAGQAAMHNFPWHVLSLDVSGGGNIAADGTPQGAYNWEVIQGDIAIAPNSALIIWDILD